MRTKLHFERVLVLAPHADDAELGCGGTMARMVDEDVEVFIAVFSGAEDSLPSHVPRDRLRCEAAEATSALGVPSANLFLYEHAVRKFPEVRQEILEAMVKLRRQVGPELVLTPSANDTHQDHQVIYAESLRTFKDLSILGYELPWNHITFSAQAFNVLERRHIDRKWMAIQKYKSQLDLKRSYFSAEFIDGLAKVRGTQVKADWAEAFEVIRIRL